LGNGANLAAGVAMKNATCERDRQQRRVLVYERMDPTDRSLDWLEGQGVAVTRERAMWEAPFRRYTEEEIIDAARDYPAVMGASGAAFSRQVLESLPHLLFISKLGVGTDNIDLDYATRRGILVSNTPEQSEIADVAEHTIAMILALKKKLNHWTAQYMQAGGWRPGYFAESLAGSTVGLIGLGHIGSAVARRLTGWEVTVIAYDPGTPVPADDVALTGFETLLRTADIVSLHANPTSQNRHLINAAALKLMKPSALLINSARASLIDTHALIQGLENRAIAGCAIDVYDVEPPMPDLPLFRLPNVLVTPHTAAWTREGLEKLGWHGARNLLAMMSGEGYADIVNPTAAALRTKGSAVARSRQ
jgi:D-3-phosphoglycerate dehydrogenase / 2-oxoglutarate reductase